MTPEQLRETLLTYQPADERDALSAASLPDATTLHRQLVEVWGDLHALPDEYAWRNLAYHLIESGQADLLYALLTDYRWLQAKLDATDAEVLESDCAAYLVAVTDGEAAQAVRLIQSALRMSNYILIYNKHQLPYQLTGRLWAYRHQPTLAALWRTCHTVTPLEILETQEHPPMVQAGGALIHTLTGHSHWVKGALELKEGRILSWSEGEELILWSMDGQLLTILSGHTSEIYGAVQLFDGRLLSWSDDHTLRLWSSNGEPLTILTGHTVVVLGALQLADGRILSWSGDKTLKLWSPDGELLTSLEQWQRHPEGKDRALGWVEAHRVYVPVLHDEDYAEKNPLEASTDFLGSLTVDGFGQFMGDERFTSVAVSGQTIVVGDEAGRVIFLRVRGGGRGK